MNRLKGVNAAILREMVARKHPRSAQYSQRFRQQLVRNSNGNFCYPGKNKTSDFLVRAPRGAMQTRNVSGEPVPISETTAPAVMTSPPKNLLPLSLVTSRTVTTALPFIGHGAYIIVASGFLMTDMLQLRLVLASGYCLLVAFHALHPRPLKIPLGWSALFILVNFSAAAVLLVDRYAPENLGAEDEILYEDHFRNALTKGQFYQLLKLAERKEVSDGTLLSTEGQACNKLYFLQSGSAKLYHHGQRTATIEQGGFVNDVAFSSGHNVGAYGTVLTDGKVRLLIWDARNLRNYLDQRPEMNRNMKYLVSDHLVKSLLRQRDGARERASRKWWWTAPDLADRKF